MNHIIFIVGPTAIGKTGLSVYLAEKLKAEIFSADSMLIYRGADIITSKPGRDILEKIPHHFINIISPEEPYSVFDYYSQALGDIRQLYKKGKNVIVCGGSGLYIKALLDGVFQGPGKNQDLRSQLSEEVENCGNQAIYKKLQSVDAEAASKISPNDTRRIIRALEVCYASGSTFSELKKEAKGLRGELPLKIFGLNIKRQLLYDRINKRVDEMFEAGAIEEVKKLLKMNLSLTAGKIIGVKEIRAYLDGDLSLDEAKELMKKNTRNFAKRQLTWFRKDKEIEWMDTGARTTENIGEEIVNKLSEI
ncbi:MAG: tRNA (adenosine(37)-N6)-dimethylallyltransferase MiaA [Candidatus Omnitrophica bacterium]|nr:tRNA (adenosine(37)-N6)-dimethylallyltransferase MiaA [Candidatus Omnitrophota bacterium]